MAFLIFQYNSGDCVAVTPHSKKPYGYQDEEVGDFKTVGVEYDFDPATEFCSCLELSEDGTTVTNKYPGKTVEEQKELFNNSVKQKAYDLRYRLSIEAIKGQVNTAAGMLKLIEPRAIEVDKISGNTEKQTMLAQWRSEARAWNNTREQLFRDTVNTMEDIEAFEIDWLKEFLIQNPVPDVE